MELSSPVLEAARVRLETGFGPRVGPWWEGLGEALDALAARWELGLGDAVGRGNTSLVVRCRRAHRRAALKLTPHPELAGARSVDNMAASMASSEPFANRLPEVHTSGALNGCRRGVGEPMVLLHGGGGSWRNWSPVLPALAQEFEVIALDQPGFGQSPSPPGAPVTIPSHADAIERELDTAHCPAAHLVGNSSGGWLALELARRGRARSVVAIAPDGMSNRLEDLYRHLVVLGAHHAARFIRRHPALTATTTRRWLLNWWLFMAHPGHWSADEANAAMHDLAGGPGYLELLAWVRGRRIEGLADIECPVLIAWGSRDLLLPRWQGRRFLAALPDGLGEFKLLRGVGHLPMADDPDLIASTIVDFARRDRAPASR